VWWNEGQGGFRRSVWSFRYGNRHALAIGDFDGDGRPDVFAGAYSEAHRAWLNMGNGLFRPAVGWSGWYTP
jgi:hypothetical protein